MATAVKDRRPNILFLMCDQLQAQVFEPGHPCLTPNIDRLAGGGLRFRRAYTPNAICSPTRASLMTGLLPHSHGVTECFHYLPPGQGDLRRDKPHWAQRLSDIGYRTGYFGKWHVERDNKLEDFGWQVNGSASSKLFQEHAKEILGDKPRSYKQLLSRETDRPAGYNNDLFYSVTDRPSEQRDVGVTASLAQKFLKDVADQSQPWCCFVSTQDPHDPFIASKETFELYDKDSLPLPVSTDDDLAGRPNVYRKLSRAFSNLTDSEKREAAACYYAIISEVDKEYGRLIDMVVESGQLENTIIIFTSDHGELLGAHGLYCKNISAFEEIYNIPLIVAGPGIAEGQVTNARVGIHDLCPTLLELARADAIDVQDSRSFLPVLCEPQKAEKDFSRGFAEYNGTRYQLTQRITWDDHWKFIHNGFAEDELYNLRDDPFEMKNLAGDPDYQDQVRKMCVLMWRYIRETGDRVLLDTHYRGLRVAPFGPLISE